jgi:hypothetical protein
MNLYMVYPRGDDWCCYIFAETRNKAKMMLLHYFTYDDEYIDYGCRTIKKDVGGESEVCDEDCERLKMYDIEYDNQYLEEYV